MSEQVTEVREQERNGRVKASPLARRIARERGIDLAQLRGTGPEGRIVAEDVERAEMAPAEAPEAAPAPPARRGRGRAADVDPQTIARRLTEAWQAPVFQISMSADMSRALALRKQLVELAKDGPKPTISDVLTKIAASALMRHRRLNAEFAGEEVRIHPSANVGMAVATDRGLVVPVIRGAERLSIQEIAAARVELVDARAAESCSRPTSRAARSRSPTSGCSASSSSSPSSTRRRSRSSPSGPSRRSRSFGTARSPRAR